MRIISFITPHKNAVLNVLVLCYTVTFEGNEYRNNISYFKYLFIESSLVSLLK